MSEHNPPPEDLHTLFMRRKGVALSDAVDSIEFDTRLEASVDEVIFDIEFESETHF